MKKYFAIMVAALFLFGVVGVSFAQAPPAEVPKAKDTAPEKKSPAQEKRQQMTPEKKKAAEAPATGEGATKMDTSKKVKKSEKSKKRQAQTPEKKKASEAPPVSEGQAAPVKK